MRGPSCAWQAREASNLTEQSCLHLHGECFSIDFIVSLVVRTVGRRRSTTNSTIRAVAAFRHGQSFRLHRLK